ncbi:hypothetical protein GGR52DRAFT_430406 [Hypoxylon sp. FL1284]|nr:hypothetical protein GGR52DRAFT_430406 [Hypoxylon sp. FL1284]
MSYPRNLELVDATAARAPTSSSVDSRFRQTIRATEPIPPNDERHSLLLYFRDIPSVEKNDVVDLVRAAPLANTAKSDMSSNNPVQQWTITSNPEGEQFLEDFDWVIGLASSVLVGLEVDDGKRPMNTRQFAHPDMTSPPKDWAWVSDLLRDLYTENDIMSVKGNKWSDIEYACRWVMVRSRYMLTHVRNNYLTKAGVYQNLALAFMEVAANHAVHSPDMIRDLKVATVHASPFQGERSHLQDRNPGRYTCSMRRLFEYAYQFRTDDATYLGMFTKHPRRCHLAHTMLAQ